MLLKRKNIPGCNKIQCIDHIRLIKGDDMTADSVTLSCACGTVKGRLRIVPGSFFHVHCLCCDCQRFASYLGNEEKILDECGGTELFQTYPAYMEITEGREYIACVQLRENSLYLWHTTCCNMPLANTMTSAKVPFVGVSVKLMQFENEAEKLNALGPVTLKAYGRYAKGEMPADAHFKFPFSYIPKIMSFMLKGKISKRNRPSPFFLDEKPIIKATVL